ncbi:hypothetical protein Tco_0810413 [Tanacetum coccineum]
MELNDETRRQLMTIFPGVPPMLLTEEALFEEDRRLREEAAGRDRPILYPTADPNMIAINMGDPSIKCNPYSFFDRVAPPHFSEEKRIELREAGTTAPPRPKKSPEETARFQEALRAKEENCTEVQVEGGVSVLKLPFEELNLAAAADLSTLVSCPEGNLVFILSF